jgi:outer membrane lipoprotein SlyB
VKVLPWAASIAGAMVGGVAGAATTKEVTLAGGTVLEFQTNQVATFYKNVTVQTNAAP